MHRVVMMLGLVLTMILVITALPAPAGAQTGTLTVEAHGFASDRGKAMFGLYDSPKGFLRTVKPGYGRRAPISGGRARAVFTDLPYGWYGVGIIHDENDNGTMDTNFIGMPREAYGISNNARGVMAQPTFDQAKFRIDGPAKTITIQVK